MAIDIGTLRVRQTIFHDVPKNLKGALSAPRLADNTTQLDPQRSGILRERMIRALHSKSAFQVQFRPDTSSIVPAEVIAFAPRAGDAQGFIDLSRKLATHLFERQDGTVSPGLLCCIEVTVSGLPGIAILKLEREQGAELHWTNTAGKDSIEMQVLDNLVLTDGTKLFKSALFVIDHDSLALGLACDGQPSSYTTHEMAQFWMQFLGCQFKRDPRLETQHWFEATISYANEVLSDPVARSQLYDHVISELNSQKTTVSAKKFADAFVSVSERKVYLDFLKSKDVSLNQFPKDVQDISSKLRRVTYHTENGVSVSAPADQDSLIKVDTKKITVNDRLKSVAKK